MNEVPFNCFRSLALDENAEGMRAMLDEGFEVNAVNAAHQTALMHCCANDRLRAANFLVARGADVNVSDHGGTTGTSPSATAPGTCATGSNASAPGAE